jgi:trehalose-phosphatase
MQYLFDARDSITARLAQAGHILLCVDFDGTICSIRARPQDARLPGNIRLLLHKIARKKGISCAIVTGRGLKDIKRKVGLNDLIFAANHGLEITRGNKNFVYPEAKKFIPVIAAISRKLAGQVSDFPGAVLEKKGLTLSLHYRLVKAKPLAELRGIFRQAVKPYLDAGRIKLTSGKKVWEVRPPVDWDKGKAVLWLSQKIRHKDTLAVYMGDDLTDEDGFRAVNKLGGISILVGRKRKSLAGYHLKGAKDVRKFLGEIERCG